MDILRQPAVAGMFYPANPAELRHQVHQYLDAAEHKEMQPKALIAPHAGYIYSGPVAASAYVQLTTVAPRIRRVVLLGPAHRLAFQGLAFSTATRFRTPLGEVTVDREALAVIRDLPQVQESDAPFEGEHCLEVQLPFLQTVLDDFKLVPLLVGDAEAGDVAEVLERLWGADETLIVISSDLSHYLDYDSARNIDTETSRAIEQLKPEAIGYNQACGRTPLNGLLLVAKRHGLSAAVLDLRNSGDTAGPRNQVVGYGAYVFS
jgi:AmmeMemoRadiSam system protein B